MFMNKIRVGGMFPCINTFVCVVIKNSQYNQGGQASTMMRRYSSYEYSLFF